MNFVLGWNDYIRIHITPILTYLTSSLQTSLQNQTKREGYEKDDLVRHKGINAHVQKLRRQRMRSFPCAKSHTISDERIDTHVQKPRTPQRH